MVPKTWILAALVATVTLAGCTSGSEGGTGDGASTTTTGGAGIGGNVTVGNQTANATASASYSMTGTNGTAPAVPDSAEVSIEDMAYVNATVTIRKGGTVTWTHNDGTTAHTVTADDASFDSSPNCEPSVGPLPPTGDCMVEGDVFTWTFPTVGDYPYHCKIHGGMTGTVRVVE